MQSQLSSDGSGLPDWWEIKYFRTTGIDPDALDSAGDGYTIWQKYQMGLNPNAFYTPAAPTGLAASINPSNLTVTLTWLPASGAVVGYTIKLINGTNFSSTYYNVGITNAFSDTSYPTYANSDLFSGGPSYYMIEADYADGNSQWSSVASPYSSAEVPIVQTFPSTQGSTVLVVTRIPPGATSLEVIRNGATNLAGTVISTNIVFPVSDFTNGPFTLPSSLTFPQTQNGTELAVQALWPNGSKSSAISIPDAGWSMPLFFDGRTQLVQNVSFLLRAASLTSPFSYELDNDLISQPTNYVYAAYYEMNNESPEEIGNNTYADWSRPFNENYRYRNFVFSDTNVDSTGYLNTGYGLQWDGSSSVPGLTDPLTFNFVAPTNNDAIIPAMLSASQASNILPYANGGDLDITINESGQFVLPNDVYNYFGLHLSSVLLAHQHNGVLHFDTLSAGSVFSPTNDTYYCYPQFDQPELQTTGYYFGRMDNWWDNYLCLGDPLPGENSFSPTNAQPLLIAAVGQPLKFAAFAKQTILNGDATKPVYVAQYFDKAYEVDTNGNVTSTETGVLSTWGDFFPTEPGTVALVTLPDINTGQRGTGYVQVVSLVVDANHDGNMNSSYYGSDFTSGNGWVGNGVSQESFWINNGCDVPGSNGDLDKDVPVPPMMSYYIGQIQPNSSYGQIRCERNLENFARLWIQGLPSLPTAQGYTATLSLDDYSSGNINLYAAYEANGGTHYLTDTNIAAAQIASGYGDALVQLNTSSDPSVGYTLPVNGDGQVLITNFLFEGVNAGSADLVLTIFKYGQPIAQSYVYLNLSDIESLYEQAAVTNVIQTWPEMVQQTNTTGFQVRASPAANPFEAQQLAVFLHGWKMSEWSYEDFSDTMFKRLYWQGFQGRFASLRWPTRSTDTDTNVLFDGLVPMVDFTYNRSERIAFESGSGAAAYFNNLRQRYPDYAISVCSHSMGGIVMMEALKELAASNQAPLDNYVLMQAAVPACCYDPTATNIPLFTVDEGVVPTPNIYTSYGASITNALRGEAINFFNPLDFALGAWQLNEGFFISSSDGPLTMKPNSFLGYSYSASNAVARVTTNAFQAYLGITNVQTRIVTNPLELMPFVARPRSLAVGAQGGVGGSIEGGDFNLENKLGFTGATYDHSGQFNRNIQTPQVQGFYTNLLVNLFPPF